MPHFQCVWSLLSKVVNGPTSSKHGARIMSLGGAKINCGGAREVYLCEFERGTGTREIYFSVDQTNKVKTKKKVFSSKISTNFGYRLKFLRFFTNSQAKTKKKGLRSKSFMKYGVSPQKLRKYGR